MQAELHTVHSSLELLVAVLGFLGIITAQLVHMRVNATRLVELTTAVREQNSRIRDIEINCARHHPRATPKEKS